MAEPDPLRARAAADPRGLAMVDTSAAIDLSWGRLDEEADAIARGLAAAGLSEGDRVATIAPAGWSLAALLHACLRTGLVLVPLSPRAPASDIAASLQDAAPRLLLLGEGHEATGAAATELLPASAAPPRLGSLETVAQTGGTLPAHSVREDADLTVLYTSGTTGPPRGVRLTVGNHLASALGCRASLRSQVGERWLLVLSVHHVGGLAILVRSAVCAQPVVALPSFDEAAVLEAMERHRPRLISLVPTMLHRLVAAGGTRALGRTRAILLGGAPADPADVEEWLRLGIPVCPTYGMTETCSQVATMPVGLAARNPGGAGLPHPYARVSIDAPSGEVGEILVGGAVLSPGYVSSAVGRAMSGEMLRSGDLGRIDPDGLLTVTGRADDAIITGGENVQPEEVEAVMRSHPAVLDAAVVGIPDRQLGRALHALVVTAEESLPDLRAWGRERLPAFKVPRTFELVESLPRGESGKLRRRDLSGENF